VSVHPSEGIANWVAEEEMSINVSEADRADNLTAICEPIV
jgi:hypothetical protein